MEENAEEPMAAAMGPTIVSPAHELVTFAATRPAWQADLIRRIYEHEGALDSDVDDVVKMLKAAEGLEVDDPPVARGLVPADVPAAGLPLDVRLAAVGPLTDVNRLEGTEPLRFALDGLTVIYGENATGKSGYCRILKSISRTRGASEQVLADVFAATPGVPKAEIEYRLGADDHSFKWAEGGPSSPDALSAITVFDAQRAPLYCDAGRRLEFLPRGLDVLPELARALGLVAGRIDIDLASARQSLSPVTLEAPAGGPVATILDRLAEGRVLPPSEVLRAAAELSEAETTELASLGQVEMSDPVTAASRLETAADLLDSLAERAQAAERLVGPEATIAVRSNLQEQEALGAAPEATGEESVTRWSELPAAGSEPWRTMFRAARDYLSLALPDRPFPDPGPDALCPLCQQKLSADAHERFAHFDEFVRGNVATRQLELVRDHESVVSALRALIVPDVRELNPLLLAVRDEARLAAVVESMSDQFQEFTERRDALVAAVTAAEVVIPDEETAISAAISELARDTRTRAQGLRDRPLEATQGDAERLGELRARVALAELLPSVLARRDQLDRIAALVRCRAACDTTPISRKGSELRERYVSAEFNERFRVELGGFGLEYLQVLQAARTEKGESHVAVALVGQARAKARDVLSDGEMRGMALAGFLADAARIPGHSPIVLDDPISSLDHHRITAVAARLVAEAKGRQVIVFTHSALFLREIWDAATEEGVPAVCHWIYSDGTAIGKIREGMVPWDVANVKERLGSLDRQLAHLAKIGDRSSEDYRKAVKAFYGDVRDTWERLVEELLLNFVLKRYVPDVQTQRLNKVEITDADYAKIFEGMTRSSKFEHDRPVAGEKSLPRHDEIARDLGNLRAMSEEIAKRLEVVGKRRRELVASPPAAELGA